MKKWLYILLMTGVCGMSAWAQTPNTGHQTPDTKQQVSIRSLEDSLNSYVHFPPCVPKVHVKNLRVKGENVTIHTNGTLGCLSLSPQALMVLRKQVSQWVLGSERGKVTIYSDWNELGSLITSRFVGRGTTPPAHSRWLTNKDLPYSIKGGLADRHLAVWPSHGYYFNLEQDHWRWQRATMWSMVEDVLTAELTNHWLVPMLENAGAYVFEPRERDTQVEEVIVTEPTRLGAQYCFTPKIVNAGTYGIYIRYKKPTDSKEHSFTVVHGGVATHYAFQPQVLSGTWQWVGEADFTSSTVENYILTDTTTIEAVRLGGGYGSIERYGQVSGLPRWTEGARYWLEYAHYPDTIWSNNNDSNDYRDDLQSRGYWVNYLKEQLPIEMSLAVHTDGYSVPEDSAIIGTLALYTHRQNRDLTDYIQTQVVEDLRAVVDSNWTRRELRDAKYAETNYPKVPAVLLEVLSHKNLADIRYALDPKVQFTLCRAIYKGVLRGLNPNKNVTVQPLPVQLFKIERQGERWRLSWQATEDTLEPTATATYYVIYTRTNGGSWDNGTMVKNPSYVFEPKRGTRYDFKVVAGNAGGVSMDSEVLSAYLAKPEEEKGNVIILNGFHEVSGPDWFVDSSFAGIMSGTYPIAAGTTRAYIGEQYVFDRSLDWVDDDNCGLGMCRQDHKGEVIQGNTFDYPCLHGQVLAKAGYSYVSADIRAYGSIDTIYDIIDIIGGLEKNESIESFLASMEETEIPVLLSGAGLGTVSRPTDGKVRITKQEILPMAEIRFATRPNEDRLFAAWISHIVPTEGAEVIGRYGENGLPAIVQWKVESEFRRLIYSFPLESCEDFETIYLKSIELLR